MNEPGRTGHNYHNSWQKGKLHWKGKERKEKEGSHVNQQNIKNIIDPNTVVHIFTREDNNIPGFSYAGIGVADHVEETVPVTVVWRIKTVE